MSRWSALLADWEASVLLVLTSRGRCVHSRVLKINNCGHYGDSISGDRKRTDNSEYLLISDSSRMFYLCSKTPVSD